MALSLLDSLAEAAKKATCQALDASEAFGNSLVYAYQEWTGLSGVNPPNFASIAKGFLCGTPVPVLPPATPTPQGGQCSCVEYRLDGYMTRNGQVSLYYSNYGLWGPLGGTRPVPGGFNPPFVTTYEIFCRGPANQPCGSPQWYPLGAGASDGNITSSVITRIRRADGLPDNCGSTPTPVTEPLPPPGLTLPSIDFTFSPDLTVNSNINATAIITVIQPKFNFNGELTIPFTLETNIDLGGINFNLTGIINVNTGDVNFNFGGGNPGTQPGYDAPCDEVPDPVTTIPDKPPDVPDKPDDPDVDEETVIIAVLVTVTNAALQRKATLIPQGSNPDIYAPSLGFVNFYCPIRNDGAGAWTSDIPVKNRYQVIPCPWDIGASGVAGTPAPGVSWSLTPIRRKRKKLVFA